MACPFFLPLAAISEELWPHRRRLPLGDGYSGQCTAAEPHHPSTEELQHFCNLGYAGGCSRLPAERPADAVRFIARAVESTIEIRFVLERAHAPAGTGTLTYDVATHVFREPHADHRIQRMAECHLQAFLRQRSQ